MATLTSAATATDDFLTVSNPAQNLAQGTLFRIDDEVLRFEGYGGNSYPGGRDYNSWMVYRGRNGTTPAAHAQGATVQAAVDAFLAGTFGDPPGPFDTGTGEGGEFDIPGLPALATPDDADELPIVDVSAAVTKKVTVADLRGTGSAIDPANIVYLESNTPAFSTVWDTIYDQEQNVIGAIPASMGVSLIEANERVQIDEPGLYWFELMAQVPNDDTAHVDIVMHCSPDYSGGPRIRLHDVVSGTAEGCLSAMISVAAGDVPATGVAVQVSTYGPLPTADPYFPLSYGVLKIVRLA